MLPFLPQVSVSGDKNFLQIQPKQNEHGHRLSIEGGRVEEFYFNEHSSLIFTHYLPQRVGDILKKKVIKAN